MPYDLFISYSRRDNERGQVAAMAEQIRTAFRAFAGRELGVFFDVREIHGIDDWRHNIQRSLHESYLFLAVLSPHYLGSPYCRWEWDEYVRYEAMRQCLGEGIAPVFFVTLPGAFDPLTDPATAYWIGEINRRQTFDLRPWYDAGEKTIQQAHLKETFEKLHASVRERLDRAELARRSPGNVLRHNPSFVGRVRELTELRNVLTKNNLGIMGAHQPGVLATVQGMGGMGKTELALGYAHAFAWDYPGGRWQLNCERLADLRLAVLQLAGPMSFEFTDEENRSLAFAFERVLRELEHRDRFLLLLDNVSEPGLLDPRYLDRLPRDGRVDLVATTRLAPTNIQGSPQPQTFIAVEEFPEEDALALLRSHQPEGRFLNQAEDDEARAVARLLEGFTLAVETAAIYLGRHAGRDACRTFRERLESGLLLGSDLAAGDSTKALRHRERLLANTLAITFETLGPEVMHVLSIASLLPADSVAIPWLRAVEMVTFPGFQEDISKPATEIWTGFVGAAAPSTLQANAGVPKSEFSERVDLLLGSRLLQGTGTTDTRGQLLVGRMHRLVQEFVKREYSPKAEALEPALLKYIRARAEFLWEGWVAHEHRWELGPLLACAWQWLERGSTDGTYLAKCSVGPLRELGRLAEAELLCRQALAMDEQTCGADHPAVGMDLNILARILRATNRVDEAESMYRRALAIGERSYGPDHPAVAFSLSDLAALLQSTNRAFEAEPLVRQALAIHERNYGPDDPAVAISLGYLASVLQDTNRLAEAEPLIRRALAINERSYGPDHPNVAADLNNLALLLKVTNRVIEAEPLSRRHLEIFLRYRQATGHEHPHLRDAIHNYAGLLVAFGYRAEQIRERLAEIGRPFGLVFSD